MSRAIDDLMHEHDAILAALDILHDMDQQLAAGQLTDTGDINAFIGFLKEFADKCHHGKEEGICCTPTFKRKTTSFSPWPKKRSARKS